MRKLTYLLLYFYFISQVLCVIPEWNLSKAGEDLLNSSNEYKYIISHRYLSNVNLLMEKEINRTSSGEITTANYIKIDNSTRKKVEFDQVESYYSMFDTYVICPKGSYHPYNFNEGQYIIPNGFNGENWDLNCYRVERENNLGFLLVFYFMNGSNKNLYITNTKNISWHDGMSLEGVQIYHYLLRYNKYESGKYFYQMIGILKNDINIELRYLIMTLKEEEQNTYNSSTYKIIINTGKFSQATFKNISENDKKAYFYYFTYNNISDLITGYSPDGIVKNSNYYSSLGKIQIKKNEYPHLEFFNDMEIEEMNFLLNNKFLYYKMKAQKDGTIYYGIFDIVLNKIIFNTKEKIITFIPHSDGAMLAITSTTAYKICTYKNGTDCTDTCSNSEYLLDIEGNKCGSSCPEGKYLFKPSGVCINECDQSIYVLEGNTCQLCKDKDESKPYKLINGSECLSEIPKNAIDYNEKLKLLKCKEGYHSGNNTCMENCYELCKTCTEFSTDENDQKCTECINNFEIANGNCQCHSGYEKKNKTCELCNNSTCATFDLNSCDCQSCINNSYYLENKTCKKCEEPCSTCETSATKCTECINNSYFLDNNECKECPKNCKENVTDSCKCKTCNDGFYLDSFYCKNCSSNCKKCDNYEKCNECNSDFYKSNDLCNKCDDICETCDGGKENDTNYHCLSCDIRKDKKYLINETGIHKCVENCSEFNMIGRIIESNKYVCMYPENKKEKEKENDADYMLWIWIFVPIIAVILIIISVFICKKYRSKSNEIESIDEVEGELIEQ